MLLHAAPLDERVSIARVSPCQVLRRGRVGLFSSQLRARVEYSTKVLPGKPGPELSGTPGKPGNSGHPGPGRPARTPYDRPGRIPGRVPGPGKTPGQARLPGLGRGRLRATPGARGSAGLCPGKPGQPGHRPGKPGKPGKQQETLADNFRSGLPPHKRTGSLFSCRMHAFGESDTSSEG